MIPPLFSAALAVAVAAPPPPPTTTTTTTMTTVPATDAKSCRVFLRAPKDANDLPIIVDLIGSGLATTADPKRAVPVSWPLAEQGRIALVTLDPPGVVARSDGNIDVDDTIYNSVTPADLEVCFANALRWLSSRTNANASAPIALHGHSQGAVIAVRGLLRLERESPALAKRVRFLLLDGAPGGPLDEIEEAQLGVLDRVQQKLAFALDSDGFFRSRAGIGVATARAFFALPPLSTSFDELADLHPGLSILLVHGKNDVLVPVHGAEDLERASRARAQAGRPALRVSLRVVDAGHALNDATVVEMQRALCDALAMSRP